MTLFVNKGSKFIGEDFHATAIIALFFNPLATLYYHNSLGNKVDVVVSPKEACLMLRVEGTCLITSHPLSEISVLY